MDEELKPYQQYIYEKLLSDMFGCTSVTTFEEWLEIKQNNYERIRKEISKPNSNCI